MSWRRSWWRSRDLAEKTAKPTSAGFVVFGACVIMAYRMLRYEEFAMDLFEYMKESMKIDRQRAFAKKQSNPAVREKVLELLDRQQKALDDLFAKQTELPLPKK